MVKFSFVLLNLLICFTDVMCTESTVNTVTFPTVSRDLKTVKDYFEKLNQKKSENCIPKLKLSDHTDHICDLKDKLKIQLCRFLLVNKPYEWMIKREELKELQCTEHKVSIVNIRVKMYKCPFSIKNDQVPIDDPKEEVSVDDTSNEPVKKKHVWISQGRTENEAFVYAQDGDNITGLYLDAVVHDLSTIKKLEELRSIDLLSREGKKYVHFWDESPFTKNIWDTYVKSFTPSEDKTVDAAQVTNETTYLDVRKLSPIQLVFLCYQVTSYKNRWHKLNLKQQIPKETDPFYWNDIPAQKCPPLLDIKTKEEKEMDCAYILVNIGEPAAIMAFLDNSSQKCDLNEFSGPFYMNEIDMKKISEIVKEKPCRYFEIWK